jgi:methylated-DNA-[protein]-cysteine S-methyltransferase
MDEAGIYARAVPGLDRTVQIGVAGGRVISVSFPREPDPESSADHDLLDRIEASLGGEPDGFEDVTVALTVPTDRRRALERLREVPYGETVSVEALARMAPGLDAEAADARDTVRAALADDPAPLLIPDHRVIDATGAAPPDVADRLRELEGIAGNGGTA